MDVRMNRIALFLRRLLGVIATRSFADGARRGDSLALERIRNRNTARLLDVGCGDGTMTVQFAAGAGAERVYGIEYDDEELARARSLGIECSKLDLNERWDFEDDCFDVILSRFNFEHLHNTRVFLKECHRCLKPGGSLVIITENLSSWINIMSLLIGWQPFSLTQLDGWWVGNPLAWHAGDENLERSFDKWEDENVRGAWGHLRVLSFQGMKELLAKAGFRDVYVGTRGYLPLWGKISDALCEIDRRHGHILVSVCSK